MAIAFDTIPSTLLTPLSYSEIVPGGTPFQDIMRVLLIGYKWTYSGALFGNANTGQLYPLSGPNVDELFGPGSILASMYRKTRAQAPFAEIWGLAIDEPGASVAATGQIVVANDASLNRSGVMTLMIAGRNVAVRVLPTDLKANIAVRLRAAINSSPQLPVTAKVNATDNWKVDLTAKFKGAEGNEIRIIRDFSGTGRSLSERLLTAPNTLTGGSGASGLASGLAAISGKKFDIYVCPFASHGNFDTMRDFMDGISGEWSPFVQEYGHVISAFSASYATQITFAALRNDPHLTYMGIFNAPQPPWEWAAAIAGVAALRMEAPPTMSRPMQGIVLKDIIPPADLADTWDAQERNSLLYAGVAMYDVDASRQVRINRLVTSYKTGTWGSPDNSWRDMETMFQASYYARSMRQRVETVFPQAALTDEDSKIPGFASPGQIKDVKLHEYIRLKNLGLVENVEGFASTLIVERNAVDANRVDTLQHPDFVNQYRIDANRIVTHLQLREEDLQQGDVEVAAP